MSEFDLESTPPEIVQAARTTIENLLPKMFWILLSIVAMLVILSEIQFQWKYRSLNRYPGPLNIPLIGAFVYFYSYKSIISNMFKLKKYYGNIIKITLLRQTCLLISDPDMLEFFLRSPKFTTKADNYYYLESWLGKGIFLETGIQGQKLRKICTPSFHFNIMEDHVAIFNTHSDIFIEILRKHVNSNCPLDIYPKVGNFTLDIITETAAGVKSNVQTNENTEFIKAMHFLTHIPIDRTLSFWKRFDCLFRLSTQYKKQQRYIQFLENISIKAIEERLKILLKNFEENRDIPEADSEMKKKKTIFLDTLLTCTVDGKPISNKQIITEINGFLFAGHDTTASTISLMMYALANYKEVQDKIVAELKEIFGDDCDRPVTMQDLGQMRYMDLAIKEVLRFYGIVPFIGRKITEDVDYNGTIIPKDTTLVLFLYGVHRSTLYENHKEFNPDRFLTTNYIKPYSFVPFSAGPKNCLGQKYAVNEVKVTFAKLLRHFEFEAAGPAYKLELMAEMVMKPSNGIYVNIKSREF